MERHYDRNHKILFKNNKAFLLCKSAKILFKYIRRLPKYYFLSFSTEKWILLAFWIIFQLLKMRKQTNDFFDKIFGILAIVNAFYRHIYFTLSTRVGFFVIEKIR